MSNKLQLKTETLRTLVSSELDGVFGGVAAKPTATAVSSARPGGGGFAHPTATAVSSARPGHEPVSSARPTATAVSSAIHATATAVSSARHFSSISSIVPTGRP